MKEENIVFDICTFLNIHGISVEQIHTEGYFDTNRSIYRKRKSSFSRNGSSDIHANIPPQGVGLFIEVKTPNEMSFFNRSAKEHEQRLQEAMRRNLSKQQLKKYQHALEQAQFLEEKRAVGCIAFFACSMEQVKERILENGFKI